MLDSDCRTATASGTATPTASAQHDQREQFYAALTLHRKVRMAMGTSVTSICGPTGSPGTTGSVTEPPPCSSRGTEGVEGWGLACAATNEDHLLLLH